MPTDGRRDSRSEDRMTFKLDVISSGYPQSLPVDCTKDQVDAVEQVAPAGSNSGLTYDAASDQYNYVWKTDQSFSRSCRQFVIRLKDGSYHRANFNFTK